MLGCWAHARRKFVEVMKENEKLASEALVYIGDLYHIETLADGPNNEERIDFLNPVQVDYYFFGFFHFSVIYLFG